MTLVDTTSVDSIVKSLDRVDWNFSATGTSPSAIHTLHWYPGNFIPQIPSYLIQILSRPGDTVFDPFCGSGTTGVEALRLLRHSIQSDINQVALSVAKGKIAAFNTAAILDEIDILHRSFIWEQFLSSYGYGTKGEGLHPDLIKWLHHSTHKQLLHIWAEIEKCENDDVRTFIELIFSDVLFKCLATKQYKTKTGNSRRHHWGWVADNVVPKNPFPHNAIALFNAQLVVARKIVSSLKLDTSTKHIIIRQDSRHIAIPNNCIDVIITSPPYLGMIDYTLANRLDYNWRNIDFTKDKQIEIGARFARRRISALDNYLSSMNTVADELHRVLKSNGFCAIVIGGSRAYPTAAQDVLDIFKSKFELIWGPISRIAERRRISERKGTMGSEFICVYRKS